MLTDGLECCDVFIRLSFWRHPFTAEHPLTHSDGTHSLQSIYWLILTAPIHCRAAIDSLSDGTHSLQSSYWLPFWRHPFTAEQLLTLILTAPIHCRASIGSHSDGTHSLQSIYWLSFWRHPFTAEHPLLRHWCSDTFLQTWWRNKLILILDGLKVNTFLFLHVKMYFIFNMSSNKRICLACDLFHMFSNKWLDL